MQWIGMGCVVLALTSCLPIQPAPQPSPSGQPTAMTSPSISPAPSSLMSPAPTPFPTPSHSPAEMTYPVELVAGTGENLHRDGPAKTAAFQDARGLCQDQRDGAFYITEATRIRKLLPDLTVITVAGGDELGYADGPAASARFHYLAGCAVSASGDVIMADILNHRLRKLTPDGQVTTLAGSGSKETSDGKALDAGIFGLNNLIIAPDGTVYFTDSPYLRKLSNQEVSTLNPEGGEGNRWTLNKGPMPLSQAVFGRDFYLTWAEGTLYIASRDLKRIRRVDDFSTVTSIAGVNEHGLDVDGTASQAFFDQLESIVYDRQRKLLWVDDNGNIRRATLDGTVKTLALTSSQPGLIWKENRKRWLLYEPLVLGTDNNLYILDVQAHQIKRVVLPPP